MGWEGARQEVCLANQRVRERTEGIVVGAKEGKVFVVWSSLRPPPHSRRLEAKKSLRFPSSVLAANGKSFLDAVCPVSVPFPDGHV